MLRLRQRERQAVRARSHRGRNRLPEKRSRDGSYFIFSSFSWHDLGSGWAMCGVETLDGNLAEPGSPPLLGKKGRAGVQAGKSHPPTKGKKKKRRVFEKTGRGDVVYGSIKNREWA